MEPKERFKKLLEFRGWGNPDNAIWFVGIEEAGDWTNNKCENSFKEDKCALKELGKYEYEKYVDYCILKNYNKPIAEFEYKDVSDLKKEKLYKNYGDCFLRFFNDHNKFESEEIMKCLNKCGNESHHIFVTNLFPLGFKNIKEKTFSDNISDYEKIFGHDFKDRSSLYNKVKNSRYELLRNFLSSDSKVILLLGIGYIPYYYECFCGEQNFMLEYIDDNYYYWKIENEKLFIIVKHMSRYPVPNAIIHKVRNHLGLN